MKRMLRLIFCSLVAAVAAHAQPASVITLARTYLGGENALNGMQAVRFNGTITTTDTDNDGAIVGEPAPALIEIIFRRGYQQRIAVTSASRIEVTALDDYEGWQRVENPENPEQWRISLLGKDQIKRLRANTWENLHFFRGIEERGGRVTDEGRVEVEGETVHKLAFRHDDRIVFFRYINPTTGRLVLTETDSGAVIREIGQMRVAGIRFPEAVITESPLYGSDGVRLGTRTITVNFENIEVNPTLSDDLFRVPSLTAM